MRAAPHAAGVLMALVLLGGCAQSGPSPDDLAAQACGKAAPKIDGTSPQSGESYDQQRDAYDRSATLAARAARADRAWETLARAYSNEVDIYDRGRDAYLRVNVQHTPSLGDAEFLQDLYRQANEAESAIRAECRKAQ